MSTGGVFCQLAEFRVRHAFAAIYCGFPKIAAKLHQVWNISATSHNKSRPNRSLKSQLVYTRDLKMQLARDLKIVTKSSKILRKKTPV